MIDLVSGTKIAVKSAPMIQSAAYNQKVPENLSGDCTCWQRSQRLNLQMKTLMTFAVWLEAKLIIYQVLSVHSKLTRSMKVLETMKPAMKAKQIIIEFAIDRT